MFLGLGFAAEANDLRPLYRCITPDGQTKAWITSDCQGFEMDLQLGWVAPSCSCCREACCVPDDCECPVCEPDGTKTLYSCYGNGQRFETTSVTCHGLARDSFGLGFIWETQSSHANQAIYRCTGIDRFTGSFLSLDEACEG